MRFSACECMGNYIYSKLREFINNVIFSIRISENMVGMLNATLCSKSMSELFLCMNLRPTASESAALTISNKVLVKSN